MNERCFFFKALTLDKGGKGKYRRKSRKDIVETLSFLITQGTKHKIELSQNLKGNDVDFHSINYLYLSMLYIV